MMRIGSATFCGVILSLVLAPGVCASERILSFRSNIEVLADSSMLVTEKIRVVATGDQIKRGIYREFPTDYRDRLNNRIQIGFDVLEVMRDGISEAFVTEKYGNGVRVYIGDANEFLEPGEYEYAIRYRTTRQLGYFADHDELYWNVTGNGWSFPIDSASATVRLPAGIERANVSAEGYTGPFGATGQDYGARVGLDAEIYIHTSRGLGPSEGLTIVVSWPKGFVVEPTAADRVGYLLQDNRGLLIALGGLALVILYLGFVWSRYGRDPQPGPIFPHYMPPPKLSPGACRYIMKMGHDNEAFAAAVLNLGVKGYITIHQGNNELLGETLGGSIFDEATKDLSPLQKKIFGPVLDLAENALEAAYENTFVLEKKQSVADLPAPGPGEKVLLEKLFVDDNLLVLTNSNHKVVSKAISAHEAELEKFYRRAHFVTNSLLVLPALLIAIVSAVLVATTVGLTPLPIIILSLVLPLVVIFGNLMKAPTTRGRRLIDKIDGFKMYLTVAEAEDLQHIEGLAGKSPEKTPELFEQYLPYAVAFDVAQPWAEQFESMLMKISAANGRSYRPGWYNSSKPMRNFSRFTTDMTGSLSQAISSSSTAPGSSSGSGGGGSSGGGGGGGGGGGW